MNPIRELIAEVEHNPDSLDQLQSKLQDTDVFPIVDIHEVTFIYFGDDEVTQVELQHSLHGVETQQTLTQVPNSQIFWLTLEVSDKARIEYQFIRHTEEGATVITDPRNPQQTNNTHSVCTMSQYREPSWTNARGYVPPGSIENWDLFSNIFAETKAISVYLPHEYQAQKKYPVLICLDGEDYVESAGFKTVLDNLIHLNEMLPTIVVLINSNDPLKEYAANPLFATFIQEELFSALRERYRIANNPDQRGILASGLGAVAALYTHWRHPELFGKLLLQSGSFYFTDIGEHEWGTKWDPVVEFVNGYREHPGHTPAIFLSCGVFDQNIYYNRTMAHLWTSQDATLRYVESQDGHNWIAWRDQLRSGLTWAFPGHLRMIYN